MENTFGTQQTAQAIWQTLQQIMDQCHDTRVRTLGLALPLSEILGDDRFLKVYYLIHRMCNFQDFRATRIFHTAFKRDQDIQKRGLASHEV